MLKTLLLLFIIVSCQHNQDIDNPNRLLALRSPFESTVDGITIPNAHSLRDDKTNKARLIRGMAPQKNQDLIELKQYGVSHILVFKNEIRTEIQQETTSLRQIGMKSENIKNIAFRYKEFEDQFTTPCLQTLEALAFINQSIKENSDARLYFHCTVGEDRTGYLAGLIRLLDGKTYDLRKSFDEELCLNGYAEGNPRKPKQVVHDIHRELTPLFKKMAFLISRHKISWQNLDKTVCQQDVQTQRDFKDFVNKYDRYTTKCQPSKLYKPEEP